LTDFEKNIVGAVGHSKESFMNFEKNIEKAVDRVVHSHPQ
jgi:hypothetical protein